MTQLADLSAALDALLAASSSALDDLPNEDTATVLTQAQKAVHLVGDLRAAVTSCSIEQSLHVLHGLNNKLTGAMSLTMLAREDLAPGHESAHVLKLVEERARAASEIVRSVAEGIKAGALLS